MAHGYTFNSQFKHDQMVEFKDVFSLNETKYKLFKDNYDFIWDVYDDVAKKYNIKIPKFWVTCERYKSGYQRGRNARNFFIMEPRAPIVHVDFNYQPMNYLSAFRTNGEAVYSNNWYTLAENFFMVRYPAFHALKGGRYTVRPGIMCERWRAISPHLTN